MNDNVDVKREEDLKKLQELYANKELVTDSIKREAQEIKGISGQYFRNIVKGVHSSKKTVSHELILECLNALKQAIENDTKRREEFIKEL
ncbi:MAG: hypothetical protein HRT68_16735 [Flavobacteriaceae bacterium]|nr:hypothetical protein [Flavobacteriaceae bacterium]